MRSSLTAGNCVENSLARSTASYASAGVSKAHAAGQGATRLAGSAKLPALRARQPMILGRMSACRLRFAAARPPW
jgi:hypothetical protein